MRCMRQAHARHWIEHEGMLRETFSRSKVDWVSVATDEDYVKAMMMLFASRG